MIITETATQAAKSVLRVTPRESQSSPHTAGHLAWQDTGESGIAPSEAHRVWNTAVKRLLGERTKTTSETG